MKSLKFAIVDIETTGGNAIQDRITEIAIYIHDGERIIDEFSSLINPERFIPPYISRLTGIDNEMVADAPRFFEVAKDIVQITEGCTFVAHNAQFDYGFIRQEFKSLGFTYSRDHLCTVRLSRKILPGHPSYSLGNLCSRLGITIENRHRAGGDAYATVKLFELLLQNDRIGVIDSSVKNDYLQLRFPPELDRSILDKLPEDPGVYYLHNQDGSVIYVGKSNNIRKRVLSHFANKANRRAIELRNAVRDISFELTGNELVALLLESDEIKRIQPVFNRAQRRTYFNYGIVASTDEIGYKTLKPVRVTSKEEPLVMAASLEEAKELLEKLIRKHRLCQKLCGLYPVSHACFHYSIGQCDGACTGKEEVNSYNMKVESALESLRYKQDNFLILERGRMAGEKTVIQVHNGKYRGFGYLDEESAGADIDTICDIIQPRNDNRDIQRILRHYLSNAPSSKIITY